MPWAFCDCGLTQSDDEKAKLHATPTSKAHVVPKGWRKKHLATLLTIAMAAPGVDGSWNVSRGSYAGVSPLGPARSGWAEKGSPAWPQCTSDRWQGLKLRGPLSVHVAWRRGRMAREAWSWMLAWPT